MAAPRSRPASTIAATESMSWPKISSPECFAAGAAGAPVASAAAVRVRLSWALPTVPVSVVPAVAANSARLPSRQVTVPWMWPSRRRIEPSTPPGPSRVR
jgi:hypothetical protein